MGKDALVKFGTLKSIGHNIANSVASGVGIMVGVYTMDIFGEAAASPEGFIEVDFLTSQTSGAKPSDELAGALDAYAKALPDLCRKHGTSASEFKKLSARFFGRAVAFTVTVEDQQDRHSTDEYFGLPGKRPKILDHLGRVRTQRS